MHVIVTLSNYQEITDVCVCFPWILCLLMRNWLVFVFLWFQVVSIASVMQLAFQSIGVVYGDIGTSPLYVFSSIFSDRVPTHNDIIGALSLIIYSLTLFPLIKYVFIVLWANDNGDGEDTAPQFAYETITHHSFSTRVDQTRVVAQV